MPRVSVVIPALNEARNLAHVLPYIPPDVDEVILVDGRSTDETVAVARILRPDVRVVQQTGRGKGAALRSGFEAASGEIIVMLDADGSTDPREIPAFVSALVCGADFAKGSRFLQGAGTADMSRLRQLGNRCFVSLVRLLFGGRYSDLCYGYNAFWAAVLPYLRINADGFEIETVMNIRALRAGLRVVEVPSYEHRRIVGVGRLRTFPDGWRVLKAICRERVGPPRFVHVGAGPLPHRAMLTVVPRETATWSVAPAAKPVSVAPVALPVLEPAPPKVEIQLEVPVPAAAATADTNVWQTVVVEAS